MIILPGPDATQFTDTVVSIEDLLFGLELDGVAWIFEDLKGWTLGSGVRTAFVDRPGAHGALDAPVLRGLRVIALSGVCLAETAALAEQANDALGALLADGSLGTFTVTNSRRSLSASVRLSDEPLDSWLDDTAFTWSLQFTAPDRRKYGDAQTASCGLPSHGGGMDLPMDFPMDFGDPGDPGRVSVVNTGNAPSEPTFAVTPAFASGFEITRVETGQRLRYAAPVVSELTLDCAAGTVLTDGQRRERFLTVRQWPSVLPGESATFQLSTLGAETAETSAASLSVSFSPAFN